MKIYHSHYEIDVIPLNRTSSFLTFGVLIQLPKTARLPATHTHTLLLSLEHKLDSSKVQAPYFQ